MNPLAAALARVNGQQADPSSEHQPSSQAEPEPVYLTIVNPQRRAMFEAMIAAGFGVRGYKEWDSTDGAGWSYKITRVPSGKKRPVVVGSVHQHGQGGCNDVWFERTGDGDMARMAIQRIVAEHPTIHYAASGSNPAFDSKTTMDDPLDSMSGELYERGRARRFCKRKLCFVRPGGEPGSYVTLNSPDSEAARQYVIGKEGPDVVFLNDQPWAE